MAGRFWKRCARRRRARGPQAQGITGRPLIAAIAVGAVALVTSGEMVQAQTGGAPGQSSQPPPFVEPAEKPRAQPPAEKPAPEKPPAEKRPTPPPAAAPPQPAQPPAAQPAPRPPRPAPQPPPGQNQPYAPYPYAPQYPYGRIRTRRAPDIPRRNTRRPRIRRRRIPAATELAAARRVPAAARRRIRPRLLPRIPRRLIRRRRRRAAIRSRR